MVTAAPTQRRLTLQTAEIAPETMTIRSQDWDRDRFDIEFGLKNGTTYNSFIIRGDKVALVDTSHEKFRTTYLDLLKEHINPSEIDYLIISHTEPDHSGLVVDILAMAPHITIVGSKVALQFLENLVHKPFNQQIVKGGDQLDLGQGHVLEFIIAPNLHWPDTMLSFDHKTRILFTCDVFGMHHCSEDLYDEDFTTIQEDFRFYYECLMAPNARSVLTALKRMEPLPEIALVGTGHGPLLKHHITEWIRRYETWSQNQTKGDKSVAVFYVSDYGYSDRLTQAVAKGITKAGVAVDMMDLKSADPQDIHERVSHAAGIVISTPPMNTIAIETTLGTVLAATHPKQLVGIVASCGPDDEPIDPLTARFTDLGLTPAFTSIRAKEPSPATYQACEEAGTDMAQALTKQKLIKQMKSLDADLDKALGRLSGGLYIITAKRGEAKSAMLASWVAQASFNPPGITIAVAKDRAIESFMHVGDPFVLNVLEEGNHLGLMRHFLKWFPPGADRFEGVKVYDAANGGIILAEALAYLECEVVSRLEASDHWIVYSQVLAGRVSKTDGATAAHHRKVGNHY